MTMTMDQLINQMRRSKYPTHENALEWARALENMRLPTRNESKQWHLHKETIHVNIDIDQKRSLWLRLKPDGMIGFEVRTLYGLSFHGDDVRGPQFLKALAALTEKDNPVAPPLFQGGLSLEEKDAPASLPWASVPTAEARGMLEPLPPQAPSAPLSAPSPFLGHASSPSQHQNPGAFGGLPADNPKVTCICENCQNTQFGGLRQMPLCSVCRNKRCPKATDHFLACTGSNAVGQKGSSWEHVKPW